jgi:hypothetical protein
MSKPANCIVLIINELNDDIQFEDDYNVHGKPVTFVQDLLAVTKSKGAVVAYSAGFFTTQKRDSALYGTQYGFRLKSAEGAVFTFGAECPLTSMYTDNNCYCAFDKSAEEAANATTDKNVQEYYAEKGDVCLSIKCNSGAGSIAYYVARIFNKEAS